MVVFKCMACQKEATHEDLKRRVRCKYCGSKIFSKPRVVSSTVEAV